MLSLFIRNRNETKTAHAWIIVSWKALSCHHTSQVKIAQRKKNLRNSFLMLWNPAKSVWTQTLSDIKYRTDLTQQTSENLIWVQCWLLMDRLETFTCQIFVFGFFPFWMMTETCLCLAYLSFCCTTINIKKGWQSITDCLHGKIFTLKLTKMTSKNFAWNNLFSTQFDCNQHKIPLILIFHETLIQLHNFTFICNISRTNQFQTIFCVFSFIFLIDFSHNFLAAISCKCLKINLKRLFLIYRPDHWSLEDWNIFLALLFSACFSSDIECSFAQHLNKCFDAFAVKWNAGFNV